MDKIKENLNLIIGLLAVLFIGFIIYNTFIKDDVNNNGITETVIGDINPDTRRIIEVLDKINGIHIDSKFFNESASPEGYGLAFNDLEDFSQPIPNKRPGKINPFVKGGAVQYINATDNQTTDAQEESESSTTDTQFSVVETKDTTATNNTNNTNNQVQEEKVTN